MLASTEDASQLLAIAKKELDVINDVLRGTISIKAFDWKKSAVSGMGNAQENIFEQANIEEADYFVSIFRFNYGKPTGNKYPDSELRYNSGMEEEFYKAYHLWELYKSPEIMIFKSEEPVPRDHIGGIKKLENFFKDFHGDGKHPGLYNTFKNEADFAEKFRKNILARVFKTISDDKPAEYDRSNMTNIFFDNDNSKRNSIKAGELQKTETIRLQAKSCYSFLATDGILQAPVRKALDKGSKFELIIQNPWTLHALQWALTADDFAKQRLQYKKYEKKTMSAEDIMDTYKQCHWIYARYELSIKGYKDLSSEFKGKIELRVTNLDLSNSILFTDDFLFLEPYIHTLKSKTRSLSLFEVQIPKGSEIYKDTSDYFASRLRLSEAFGAFKKNEDAYKETLLQDLASVYGEK